MRDEHCPFTGPAVRIREATSDDLAEVGDIRVSAYQAGGFLRASSGYAPMLRGLGVDGLGLVLVAVAPAVGNAHWVRELRGRAERIVGTVMLQRWPDTGQVVLGPDEAEIRALAVRPEAQGSGIGALLLSEVIRAARAAAVRHLVLCTEPEMRTARRMYERSGFVRLPERDWAPDTHTSLLVYGLRLG